MSTILVHGGVVFAHLLKANRKNVPYTEFVEAAVAQLLSAEAQLLQICTLEALWTLVALAIGGAVGVWDGQAVPRHLPEQ